MVILFINLLQLKQLAIFLINLGFDFEIYK